MARFPLNDLIRNALWAIVGVFTVVTSVIEIQSAVPNVAGINLWGWVAIAFALAIVITILQYFKRKGDSPVIEIELSHNDFTSRLYVDVTNKGVEGLFESQLRVIESSDVLLDANQGIYRGCWEETKTAEVTIRHGETKRLLIAEFHKGSFSSFLRIFGESFGGYHQLSHSYPIGGDSNVVIPEVFLISTISTSPKAWRGSKVLALRIWANDRYEVCYNMPKKQMSKIKDVDIKKLETPKQDFEALLKKACRPKSKSSPKRSKR